MIDERFIFLGAFINFLGSLSYLRSTLRGETKPNRVTWILWIVAPMLAFSAQIKQGVGLISLTTFMAGFNPMLILLASFINKKSEWKITKFDLTCGALSILGLILWQITKAPNLAILFAIAADGLAAAPTVVKSYYHPETENAFAYMAAWASGAITLLTIKIWTFAFFAFPIYIVLLTTLIPFLIISKIGVKAKHTSS